MFVVICGTVDEGGIAVLEDSQIVHVRFECCSRIRSFAFAEIKLKKAQPVDLSAPTLNVERRWPKVCTTINPLDLLPASISVEPEPNTPG
jgi:hypothetical protein